MEIEADGEESKFEQRINAVHVLVRLAAHCLE